MKATIRLLLAIFLMITATTALAQRGTLIVFAPQGELFTLYLGNTLQNSEAASRVEADNPGGPSFKVRIRFEDPAIKEISKLVFNKPGSTMYYKVEKNAKGAYTLESTTSEWTDGAKEQGHNNPPASSESSDQTKEQKSAGVPVKNPEAGSGSSKGCENPIPDPDFAAQLVDISARPFEPMQLSAAKKMAESHCLLVSQVIMVIHVFDMESSRLSFAKFAYQHTHDRENYSEVKEALHSEKSKDDLERFITEKTK